MTAAVSQQSPIAKPEESPTVLVCPLGLGKKGKVMTFAISSLQQLQANDPNFSEKSGWRNHPALEGKKT
jgi:hypothetical protein